MLHTYLGQSAIPITVNNIPNVVSGSSGLNSQTLSGGDTDDGYYTVPIPWQVNLNGTFYDDVYVSSNSFISFGAPSINATETTPATNKILLGTPKNTTVPGIYAKNFYYGISGSAGNQILRMRYEGGFKYPPQNIGSSSITYNLLGRASLTQYSFVNSSTPIELDLPWNANFNLSEGSIQNTIRIDRSSYILFGKSEIVNGVKNFTFLNELDLGFSAAIDGTVGGVWAGIEGTSPNRTYRVRFEADDLFSANTVVWEIILYENNKNIIDVHIGHLPNLITMGWFGQSRFFDLTNTSGDYKFKGTRFSQNSTSSSIIWESTLYENNPSRIDIQLGERIDPSSTATTNYYYGVYSSDASLHQFSNITNSGYEIISPLSTASWRQVQNLYARESLYWRKIRQLFVKELNVWKPIFNEGPIYFFCRRSTNIDDTYGNKGGTGIAAFQNESFVVPDGVTEITVELWGGGGSGGVAAKGGDSNTAVSGTGGGGGYVKSTLLVTPGETLTVRVGGGAWHYSANTLQHPNVTISGATSSSISVVSRRSDATLNDQTVVGGIGGSGGGYSAIFRGTTALLIAGGGGGGGGTVGYAPGDNAIGGAGGAGGGTTGQNGENGNNVNGGGGNGGGGGGGGSQTAGGAGGTGATGSLCTSSDGESGSYLTGGRGKNNPEYQGNLAGSTLIPDNGTASNPGTNGGAAGGGSARTRNAVCNPGTVGAANFTTLTLYLASSCGGGGGGGYYGGGGGGVGRYNSLIEDTSIGGGGGGGGSNYVGGALTVISNSQGNRRVPGNTTSPYYLTSYLLAPSGSFQGLPYNAFAQGGSGYGGNSATAPILNSTTLFYGTRGENGLVVIYW